jgi:hypothetical protein
MLQTTARSDCDDDSDHIFPEPGLNLPATTSRIFGPPSLHTNNTTKAPEYYNNAKYEDIGLAQRSEGVHTVNVRMWGYDAYGTCGRVLPYSSTSTVRAPAGST